MWHLKAGDQTCGANLGMTRCMGLWLFSFPLLFCPFLCSLYLRTQFKVFLLSFLFWKTFRAWWMLKHQIKQKTNLKSFQIKNETKKEKNVLPLGEAPLETLWERMMAIQPSTSTKASFLNSAMNTVLRPALVDCLYGTVLVTGHKIAKLCNRLVLTEPLCVPLT